MVPFIKSYKCPIQIYNPIKEILQGYYIFPRVLLFCPKI